jgi:hypothetical protein
MESLFIPGLTALRSTDATVIRQIVMSLVNEIERLNKRISSLENNAQTPTKKEKYYGV